MSNSTHDAYGLSLDAFYGFPVFEEVTSPLIVCTNPGYHVCAIQVFGRDVCGGWDRPTLTLERNRNCVKKES